VLDTLHLTLISHSMYYYLISNFDNPPALASAVWSFNAEVSVNGLIGLIVECFFARRLLRLSGGSRVGYFLAGLVCFLSLIHFGLGVFFTERLFALGLFSKFPELTWITKVGLGSAAACDLIIAVGLCWYLYQSRTGYRKTDSLIVTLMLYTLNCGLLTGIGAAMVVITFSVFPTTLFFMAFFWILGKLYCNSCVAMLNSRQALRGKLGHVVGSNISDLQPTKISAAFSPSRTQRSSLGYTNDPNFEFLYTRPSSPQTALTVRVDTTTETSRDYYRHTMNTMSLPSTKQETGSMVSLDRLPEDPATALAPSPSSTAPLIRESRMVPKFP